MFRIKFIGKLIGINEYLIFYPKLKRFYKEFLKNYNPLIIDVGSNKGQTIDFFLKSFKNSIIYGFEPNKELYDDLYIKYKNNKNIKLINCGISNQSGKLLFNETVTNETSTFEDLNFNSEYLKMKSRVLGVKPEDIIKKSYEVDVITLADFIEKENIKHIDVIKIDTEGHEYKCLLGLFTKSELNINYIQLEQHNDDMYANRTPHETINKLLNDNNFNIFKTVKHGFGDLDEVIYKCNNSKINL